MNKVFITGTAGFIGFHLARCLLEEGFRVFGYDGFTDYYDVGLKRNRHSMLTEYPNFSCEEGMLENDGLLDGVADGFGPDVIVHLAAQAGVRYSLEQPRAYVSANVLGTLNVMEVARRLEVKHLLMASASLVYGANTDMPFTKVDKADTDSRFMQQQRKPMRAWRTHTHTTWNVPTTMFRFFTVYGSWGRPDLALF